MEVWYGFQIKSWRPSLHLSLEKALIGKVFSAPLPYNSEMSTGDSLGQQGSQRQVFLGFFLWVFPAQDIHCNWARKSCFSNCFLDELNIANSCDGELKKPCENSVIWLNEFMCFSHCQHHQARSSWRNISQRQRICHFLCRRRFIALHETNAIHIHVQKHRKNRNLICKLTEYLPREAKSMPLRVPSLMYCI